MICFLFRRLSWCWSLKATERFRSSSSCWSVCAPPPSSPWTSWDGYEHRLLGALSYCSCKSAAYQNGVLLQGFERVYLDMADISIDVPCAYSLLEQFVEQSFNAGVIDKKLRDLCPCRWVGEGFLVLFFFV